METFFTTILNVLIRIEFYTILELYVKIQFEESVFF